MKKHMIHTDWLVGAGLFALIGCSAELGPTGDVAVTSEPGDDPNSEVVGVGSGAAVNTGEETGTATGGAAPAAEDLGQGTGGSESASGGNLGSGGVPGQGSAPGTTGGASGGGEAASGGSSSGGSSSGGSTGEGCEYPAGPYERVRKLEIGDVLPPDLTWTGYDLEGNWRTVTMAELHDCDGSQGRNALIFRNVAVWCGVCSALNRRLNSELDDGWRAAGVEAYVLVSEDAQAIEATEATTRAYYDAFEPDGWAVLVDPDWTFLGTVGGGALPMQIVVDPRTMTLQGTTSGGADIPNGLAEVLERNR